MSNKIYAVRKGNETGIFTTWEECRRQVNGYAGAEFKSFADIKDAEQYLSGSNECSEKPIEGYAAYVDGSYSDTTKEFSYGVVILKDGNIIKTISKKATNKNIPLGEAVQAMTAMRNIAGEICGAVSAIQYCLKNKIPCITIYHDYEGISKWANCEWQAKNVYTQNYRDYVMKSRKMCKIQFVKVKGHSNDKYNDMADSLAKNALGLK